VFSIWSNRFSGEVVNHNLLQVGLVDPEVRISHEQKGVPILAIAFIALQDQINVKKSKIKSVRRRARSNH
jgi:hypothetical protein